MLSRELIAKQIQLPLKFCRNNNKLGNLVHDLPLDASHPLKSSKLASKLGLMLPTTDDRWALICLYHSVLDPSSNLVTSCATQAVLCGRCPRPWYPSQNMDPASNRQEDAGSLLWHTHR